MRRHDHRSALVRLDAAGWIEIDCPGPSIALDDWVEIGDGLRARPGVEGQDDPAAKVLRLDRVDECRHLLQCRDKAALFRGRDLELFRDPGALIDDLGSVRNECAFHHAAERVWPHLHSRSIIHRGAEHTQRPVDRRGAMAIGLVAEPGEVELARRRPERNRCSQVSRLIAQVVGDDRDGASGLLFAGDRGGVAVEVGLHDVHCQDLIGVRAFVCRPRRGRSDEGDECLLRLIANRCAQASAADRARSGVIPAGVEDAATVGPGNVEIVAAEFPSDGWVGMIGAFAVSVCHDAVLW
ncbi:hypothetical protein [Bosea sp. TND4EK4]|uniref:hypothetical protein n=1 Tax=Bosea sp. TND4EK4 TaxID=1907408 RepID=UPI001115A847|nr:hypothetical protein [Bosea sp. TND4EK4]